MTDNETKPSTEKTASSHSAKEPKMVFHHEKHAWPARKAFGPIILILGLLLIVGIVYSLNSFDNQYAGIQKATQKWVEHGGSVPVDEKNRTEFRSELNKIRPLPLLNNGSLAGILVNARLQFMSTQETLQTALRQGCNPGTQTQLAQSVVTLARAEQDVNSVINQLGKNAPDAENDFLNVLSSTKELATKQRDSC